jgi:hypothetical protein
MLTERRFAYAILAADELVAVSNTIKFRYDDGRTFLNWKIGEDVDTGVWITVFLILAISINMFPVKVRRPSETNPSSSAYTELKSRYLANSNTYLDVSKSRSSRCSSY